MWLRLSDFWGRKRLVVGGLFLFILTLVLFLCKISPVTIYFSLFMLGIASQLLMTISFLLLFESVSSDYRSAVSSFLPFFNDLSLIFLPLLNQVMTNWRVIYWTSIGLALSMLLPLICFIKESPKFLASVGKFEQA